MSPNQIQAKKTWWGHPFIEPLVPTNKMELFHQTSVLDLFFRRLQEEELQLRTSSLPAIPNPFPELCSPASSPVLSPGSLPPGDPTTGKHVSDNSQIAHLVNCFLKTTPLWKLITAALKKYERSFFVWLYFSKDNINWTSLSRNISCISGFFSLQSLSICTCDHAQGYAELNAFLLAFWCVLQRFRASPFYSWKSNSLHPQR